MHERKSKTSDQITMKCLHILLTTCCLISSGLAKPTSVVAYQDSLGQYSFGYTSPNSARTEIRKQNGEIQGAYTYSDGGENMPQASVPYDTLKVVASQGARPQEVAETLDHSIDVTKIGGNNVFLRDLRKEKNGSVESDERIPIQTEEENVEKTKTKNLEKVGPQSADKVLKTENSEGNLKTITEKSQETLVQNDPAATADKPALGIALISNQEELKEAKQIKSQKSAATDKPDTPQKIIAPISILPLNPVYSTFFEYTPLPYSIYSIA